MQYSQKVMDHFANPRNVGEIEDANAIGEVGNKKCGDIMKIYMKIEDDIIKDMLKTFGCGRRLLQHNNRACKGKDYKRSAFIDKQGGYRRVGRPSAGKSALQRACRRSDKERHCRLLQKTGNRPRAYCRVLLQLHRMPLQ